MKNKEYNNENDENLRMEYNQTWEDFRSRLKSGMMLLQIYFAIIAGLITSFIYTLDKIPKMGILISLIGILYSVSTVSLILGERRAWAADVTRLTEIENVLSSKNSNIEPNNQAESEIKDINLEEKFTKLKWWFNFIIILIFIGIICIPISIFTYIEDINISIYSNNVGYSIYIMIVEIIIFSISLVSSYKPWKITKELHEENKDLIKSDNNKICRIREFDRLFVKQTYSFRITGSSIWFVIIMILTGAVFGAMIGISLFKINENSNQYSLIILYFFIVFLMMASILCLITTRTRFNNLKQYLENKKNQGNST